MNKNHFEKQKHCRMEFNKYDTTHLKINWGEWGVRYVLLLIYDIKEYM